MHFTVPDTTLTTDSDGAKYWLFNVHVNGVWYCSVRYSHCDKLHEQLKKEFSHAMADCLFPPKKLFSLSPSQLEERRAGLEVFIQHISQDPEVAMSDTFNDFFSKAMQETRQAQSEEVELNVHLMNGNKVTVPILSIDRTDDVLVAAMGKIGLKDEFVYYFALFLIGLEDDKSMTIIRRLQDFEAPYLSLKDAGENRRIVIRRDYWSSKYDSDLLDDRIAMNLIYVQVVDDLDRGWIIANDEEVKRLTSLKRSGSRKEFLKVCKSLKYYGYVHFKSCICDYPEDNSTILMCAGNNEFSMRVSPEDKKVLEGNFQIQRIKSWRLSSLVSSSSSDNDGDNLAFTFEYLFTRDNLRWISVISKQAVFMSMCMQGMVDEILRENQNKPINAPKSQKSRSSSSSSARSSESNKASSPQPQDNGKTTSKEQAAASPVKNKSKSGIVSKKSGVNEVFENIGDDDL